MPCLQRRGRRRAAGAGALHVQVDDAFLVALEGDVAAVVGDGRAHAGLDQVLDDGDRLRVLGVEEFVARLPRSPRLSASSGAPDMIVLHDGAEDRRLHLLPVAVGLGDRDEVGAEENAADIRNVEQALRRAAIARRPRWSRMSSVPVSSTARPGRNFSVAGLGVASVWMNIGSRSLRLTGSRPVGIMRIRAHRPVDGWDTRRGASGGRGQRGRVPGWRRLSGPRVDIFVAQMARHDRHRDRERAGGLRQIGHQRAGAFLAGAGGQHQDADVGVLLDQLDDFFRWYCLRGSHDPA